MTALNHLIGEYLNIEQDLFLQTALYLLKKENNLKSTQFWGKINGMQNDYYIICGRGDDYFKNVKLFYSMNLLDWTLLPKIKSSAIQLTRACSTLFTGIPSHISEIKCLVAIDGEKLVKTKLLKEEDRLASTIALINEEVAAIPIGAFFLDVGGETVENTAFKGLSYEEANNLSSYIHFEDSRKNKDQFPYHQTTKSLEKDFPKESWQLQLTSGGKMADLYSLTWPGFKLSLCPNTPHFTQFYSGDGRKNYDLNFMV